MRGGSEKLINDRRINIGEKKRLRKKTKLRRTRRAQTGLNPSSLRG